MIESLSKNMNSKLESIQGNKHKSSLKVKHTKTLWRKKEALRLNGTGKNVS